jgi:hypothetical protein
VADGDVPLQGVQGGLVKDLADQSEVLVDDERTAVADRDAGRLLAAVLQGVEAEVGQLRDLLAGSPDAEDTAGILRALVVGEEVVGQVSVASGHTSSLRNVGGCLAPTLSAPQTHLLPSGAGRICP